MAAKSPFPLLNLPFVPLDEVLKSMTFQELAPLSLVSNKIKKIMKSCVKHKSYKLEIYLGPHMFLNGFNSSMDLWCTSGAILRFNIELEDDDHDSQISFSKVDDIFMTVGSEPEELVASFWKDKIERFGFLLSSFHDVFNPEIKLDLSDSDESKASRVLDMIENSGVTLNDTIIYCSGLNKNLFQKFLDVSSKKLNLGNSFRNNNFQYAPSNVPMKFESLFIHNACWAKLDYFVNCKSIILLETELKIHDLTMFLKKWMTSNYPLEIFRVQMKSTDNFDSIGRELSLTSIKNANTRKLGYKEFNDGDCFGIQRTDGKKAIIYRHFFTDYNYVSRAYDAVSFSVYFETVL